MVVSIMTTEVRSELDVILTRQRAWQIAGLLGFEPHDQTRVATAVSEIARNAVKHAGGGRVTFELDDSNPQMLLIHVRDRGAGIPGVEALMGTSAQRTVGAASTLMGVRRMMTVFRIECLPGEGTHVTLGKPRPRSLAAVGRNEMARIAGELMKPVANDPLAELQRQNRELMRMLEEHRMQQEAAHLREQWLYTTLRSIADAVVATDIGGNILTMNIIGERLTGWTQLEAAGKPVRDVFRIVDRHTRNEVEIPLKRALCIGEAITLSEDCLLLSRDGAERSVDSNAAPIRDGDGVIIGAVLVFRDISRHVAAQQERDALLAQVEAERKYLRTMMEQMPAGVILAEAKSGRLLFANRAAEEIYCLPKLTALSDNSWLHWKIYCADGKLMHSEEHPLVRAIRAEATTRDQILDIERGDGSRATLLINAAPIRDDQNAVVAGVAAFYDITERVKHLREIENLNIRLKRSIQETHHRVKNNLQIISALVDIQVGDAGSMIPVAAITRVGQHTRALAAIHDLLTHEVKANAEADTISTQAAMGRLVDLLRATSGGRHIHSVVDDFMLPIRESASVALLVSELVSNALKHGQSEIALALTAEDGTARLEVRDDGPGFPEGFDWRSAANTGLTLIDSTGRFDLRGAITYDNVPEGGGRVVVTFPLPLPSEVPV